MNEQILCVDDEAAVLAGFERTLRKRFIVHTAESGAAALERITADGPYAVVLSDMRMPAMDGIQFLREVRQISPDTTCIMLTGNGDQDTARAAINDGRIFRFLTKPCDSQQLTQALAAGIDHHQLIVAEKELLEDTLRGSIKVLTEVLSLVNPGAFGRAMQLARCVRHMSATLVLPDTWRFEVAAMLSQLGCVTVLPETLAALQAGQEVSEAEQTRFAAHASVARDLLCSIPRLEAVAEMISRQDMPAVDAETPIADRDTITLGAQLLHVAKEFDREISRGATPEQARARLMSPKRLCDRRLAETLDDYQPEGVSKVIRTVRATQLEPGMVLGEDLEDHRRDPAGRQWTRGDEDAVGPNRRVLRLRPTWRGNPRVGPRLVMISSLHLIPKSDAVLPRGDRRVTFDRAV